MALLREHLDDGVPLTRLAEAAGIPERTLRRWAAAYRADPTVTGVSRRVRSDRGTRALPVEAVEALALRRPAPTTALIHRRVGDLARHRGIVVHPVSPSSPARASARVARVAPGQ